MHTRANQFWGGIESVLKVRHAQHTSYLTHCSKSSLMVMTPFWHVKFTQLDGFARDNQEYQM